MIQPLEEGESPSPMSLSPTLRIDVTASSPPVQHSQAHRQYRDSPFQAPAMLPSDSPGRRFEGNEDDYDYAIVLRRDEQYREVAALQTPQYRELIPSAGEDDIESQRAVAVDEEQQQLPESNDEEEEEGYLQFITGDALHHDGDIDEDDQEAEWEEEEEADREVYQEQQEHGQEEEEANERRRASAGMERARAAAAPAEDRFSVLTVDDYVSGMRALQSRHRRATTAARRSSVAFQGKYYSSDKELLNKMLVTLSLGIHVRRHQAGFCSEVVRLFSLDGGRTIQWAPEVLLPASATASASRRRREARRSKVAAEYSGLECCVGMCGCGDDLAAEADAFTKALPPADSEGRGWFAPAFQMKGSFGKGDILSVHKATAEDPTSRGECGTEALRGSKDPCNTAYTFSVVFRRRLLGHVVGLETLDLECACEEEYWQLARGFRLLRKDATPPGTDTEPAFDSAAFASETLRRAEALWISGVDLMAARCEERQDPVAQLFSEPAFLDPWRMVGLGGRRRTPLAAKHALPPSRFLGWRTAGTQIWARLHMAGLEVRCVYAWDLAQVVLKVRCPQWRLEEMAEKLHMKLRRRNGTIRRFKISHRDDFAEKTSSGSLFSSGERQQIIDHIIKTKIREGGAELDENTALGRHVAQCFPLHMAAPLAALRHSWVTFWKTEGAGEVPQPWSLFATTWSVTAARIGASLNHAWSTLLAQPLDGVSEYYGEGVGFLFAFMAFYTRWLAWPSVLGLVVFCFQLHDRRLDHWTCLPFAVYIMLWASFMLAYWRQRQSVLAYRWGVLDFELDETERPQFRGDDVYDETSGEVRKVFPIWKRALRYLVSVPVLCGIMCTLLAVMVTIFSTQDRLLAQYQEGRQRLDFAPAASPLAIQPSSSSSSWLNTHGILSAVYAPLLSALNATEPLPASLALNATSASTGSTAGAPDQVNFSFAVASDLTFWVIALFYPSLYGLLIYISAIFFDLLAAQLNAFENHRTHSTYFNRLVLKIFSFRFIAVFTNLYWYAFSPHQNAGNAYIRVAMVMFCLLTVGSWAEAFMGICLPSLFQRFLMYHMRHHVADANRRLYRAKEHDDANGNARQSLIGKREQYIEEARSQVWEEATQMSYTTFADYASLTVQLGLIIFFAAIFPLAPLIAFVNNCVMLRLRAYKVCFTLQRPLCQKSSGMGVWEDILQIMSVIGVLTNLAIFGVASEVLKDSLKFLGGVGIAVLLFVFEHAMLLFKYWLYTSVPRIPARILRMQGSERMDSILKKEARRLTRNRQSGGAGPDQDDGDTAVPLLAPLRELRDPNEFVSVDPSPKYSQTKEHCLEEEEEELSDSPLIRRTAGHSSAVERRAVSLRGLRGTEDGWESVSSLDSSDSDNYELARNSRSALAVIELRQSRQKQSAGKVRASVAAASSGSVLGAKPTEQGRGKSDARASISTRIRNFQSRRQDAESQLADMMEAARISRSASPPRMGQRSPGKPVPATRAVKQRDEPAISRRSILALLGWRTAGAADSEEEVEPAAVKEAVREAPPLTLEQKLSAVESLSHSSAAPTPHGDSSRAPPTFTKKRAVGKPATTFKIAISDAAHRSKAPFTSPPSKKAPARTATFSPAAAFVGQAQGEKRVAFSSPPPQKPSRGNTASRPARVQSPATAATEEEDPRKTVRDKIQEAAQHKFKAPVTSNAAGDSSRKENIAVNPFKFADTKGSVRPI